MKLGMVTYMWGAQWDLPTLIDHCEQAGFQGVELRTTHRHGVEVTLSSAERAEIRKRFADSAVECVGLGSACEFHSPDRAVVQRNIELTRQFVVLSHDIGASGVKVRPNRLDEGEPPERAIDRIARALRACGEFAADYEQEIRLEVHGRGTQDPAIVRQIVERAGHPLVRVCWNSNPGEVENGSIGRPFSLLKDWLSRVIHIHDLYDQNYPYRELFGLLNTHGFDGYCLSESPATSDPLRVMHYYRALWLELSRPQ